MNSKPIKAHSFFSLIFSILLVFSVFADNAQAQVGESKELRIGGILPLTGSGATFGLRVKRAMELAHKDLPPELQKQVRLYFEDDAWSAKGTVSAFHKLVNIENVNAVAALGSGASMAIAPLAEQKQIVLMAVGASNINVVKGRKYCFINWVTPEAEAELLTREVIRRKYARLALVGAEQEGMIAIYNAVTNEFKRAGILEKVILDERFTADEVDYRTFIAKARSKNVDGAVLFLLPGSIASFAKQARQSSLKADLIGIELFEDDNEVKAADGALLNQWYVTAASAPEFEKRYSVEYGERSAFGTANGYDAVKLLAAAYAKHKSNAGVKIAEFLSTVKDFSGAAGKYSASGDNRFTLPAGAKIIKETGFEDVEAR